MRFLLITDPPEGGPVPPTPEALGKLGQLMQEMTASGKLVDTGGIQFPSTGTRVKYEGGAFSVLDGPFAESKEVIAGFAIVDVASKDEALEVSRRFYEAMGDGGGECLQMFGQGEMG
jgi:hypothetical protein